ncbi:MAG: Uma2 family endonuclease [Phycisphaerales bacterium]|nr:Uma2 family endonuclease [Phycisphaerales bacterium]
MGRAAVPNEMLAGEYLFKRYGATMDDYLRAADEDSRLELFDGVLLMHSPANVGHEDRFAFLLGLLRAYVGPRRLGRVLGSRTPMVLDDDRRFEPDLLFIKTENLHRLGEVELRGPADLVIEILSPATREYDLGDKRRAYAEGGVPEYWMIDLARHVVMIDRPAGQRHLELSTGRVSPLALPELYLEASWLWQEPLPDPAECLATCR